MARPGLSGWWYLQERNAWQLRVENSEIPCRQASVSEADFHPEAGACRLG